MTSTAASQIRLAVLDERHVLARSMGVAFHDDPLMGWIYPDEHQRREQAEAWWQLCLGFGLRHGCTYTDATTAGCAVWTPPGVELFDDEASAALFGLLSEQLGPDVERTAGGLLTIAAARPEEDAYYLFGLGVHPERQGRGLGGELVAPVLQRCDVEGRPAYLESSNPRNVPFYERLGFEVVAEVELPDGPIIRPMWRPARSG